VLDDQVVADATIADADDAAIVEPERGSDRVERKAFNRHGDFSCSATR
jgi:hypothetical protein